jgi:FdhE protein
LNEVAPAREAKPPPPPSRRSAAFDDAALEALADRVLRTELYGEHADKLPFVAAALQVYWTRLAAQLGNAAVQPLDVPGVCPCCGALPARSA